MTKEAKRSIRAAALVLSCIGAMAFGAIWRDRIQLGSSSRGVSLANLVASNTDRPDLPESKFYEDVLELLKRKYVDPINDDSKLADGAVRGMVASLGDPNSLYMDPNQYRVYSNVRIGKYEGIGADLILARDRGHDKVELGASDDGDDRSSRLPKLVVAAVVPGSAADRAGLKAGDWAEFVDDHWVPNSEALDKFEAIDKELRTSRDAAHKDPALLDKFVKLTQEYLRDRKLLQDEADKHVLPIKARDRLMIGTSGEVKTQWVRNGKSFVLTLSKGEWTMPGFGPEPDGSLRLPFTQGVVAKLSQFLAGKKEAVIDLRNNVNGDFDAMLACLRSIAPNGTYGYLVTRKNEKPTALTVADGPAGHPRLTLIVDRATRGAAEIFALALSSRGIAKLDGPEDWGGDPYVADWYSLPDGAGYTLVTSQYQTNAPSGAVARAETGAARSSSGIKGVHQGPIAEGVKR